MRAGLQALLVAVALPLGAIAGCDWFAAPRCEETMCGETCADTQSDVLHCGACGSVCEPGVYTCIEGACAPSRRWEVPDLVADLGRLAGRPPTVVAGGDNKAFAWWRTDYEEAIWISSYRDAQWSEPMQLSQAGGGRAYGAVVDVDERGDALALWSQGPPGEAVVWGRVFRSSLGAWGPRFRVSGDTRADDPAIVRDAADIYTTVWRESVGGELKIIARRMRLENGEPEWKGPEQSIQGASRSGVHINLAADPQGNIHAVWSGHRGSGHRGYVQGDPYATRYDVAAGTWAPATPLETREGGGSGPQVGVDASGAAMVVWYEGDNDVSTVHARRWDPDSQSWGRDHDIADVGEPVNAQVASLAVSAGGDAIATWQLVSGKVMFSQYSSEKEEWSHANDLPGSEGYSDYAEVAMDLAGNATVVWHSGAGISAAQYWAEPAVWTNGVVISGGEPDSSSFAASVDYDARGDAVVVWQYSTEQVNEVRATWLRPNPPRARGE